MVHSKDRFPDRTTFSRRMLILMVFAFSSFACDRSQDTPSVPLTPKPQTNAQHRLPMEIRKAIFFYSSKSASPYQIEHPATANHPVVFT
jgi:hypothetical protein